MILPRLTPMQNPREHTISRLVNHDKSGRAGRDGATMDSEIRKTLESRWRRFSMRSDIVPGSVFPDYELPDQTGTLRRLSELQGDDPLMLTLARGNYCPKEHQQHLELAAFFLSEDRCRLH